MTLAIYAKKCGIDEDELRRDAFALLQPYDDMSVEDINRFTKDDVAVSYTHLDVYKRQPMDRIRIRIRSAPLERCRSSRKRLVW